MDRYRRSSGEWCLTYDTFKAADPGRIWAWITGQRYEIPAARKGVRGRLRG